MKNSEYLFLRELLKNLHITLGKEEVKLQLKQYHFSPSLKEYSFILSKWNIKNILVDIPAYMLKEAPKPIISINKKQELFFLSAIENDNYKCYICNESGYKLFSENEFCLMWDGVCILMEGNEESGEIIEDSKKREITIFKITEKFIIGSILVFVLLGFFITKESLFIYITSLFGLGFSLYLLLRERSFFTANVLDICKLGKKFDCDKVIFSKGGKIFGYSLSEISTGFFLFVIISITVPSLMDISCHYIIPVIYLSGISVVYSIFQQIKMKAYCLFCLAISCSLCLLIALVFVNYGFKFPGFKIIELLFPLLTTILIIGLIRNYLFLNETSIRLSSRINSIMNSPLIAYGFADTKIENIFFDNEIVIGNSNADFKIIFFLNPECKKCKLILKNLERFFTEFEEQIYIRILYSGPTEDLSESKRLYAYLFDSFISLDQNERLSFFKEDFIPKFELNEEIPHELAKSLTKQSNWSNNLELEGTPAIILNNVILPSYFGIEEVRDLLHTINKYF